MDPTATVAVDVRADVVVPDLGSVLIAHDVTQLAADEAGVIARGFASRGWHATLMAVNDDGVVPMSALRSDVDLLVALSPTNELVRLAVATGAVLAPVNYLEPSVAERLIGLSAVTMPVVWVSGPDWRTVVVDRAVINSSIKGRSLSLRSQCVRESTKVERVTIDSSRVYRRVRRGPDPGGDVVASLIGSRGAATTFTMSPGQEIRAVCDRGDLVNVEVDARPILRPPGSVTVSCRANGLFVVRLPAPDPAASGSPRSAGDLQSRISDANR